MTVVTPFYTFPSISWWVSVLAADTVLFDGMEHFEKMSDRNRYRISGANNAVLLSVPLVSGRSQHRPMKEVRIYNESKWQVQHWRTLVSVYKRSPYFEHYEDSLKPLFEQEYEYLVDLNRASIAWVMKQLKVMPEIKEVDAYIKDYPGAIDIRNGKQTGLTLPKYYQVFEDRIGFLPDLSILDMLFSEGPGLVAKLKEVI